MYGIHRYCRRCGGHRLLKLRGGTVLVICSGCGLMMTYEAEPVPPSGAVETETDLETILRRKTWRRELSDCGLPLAPVKHS